MVGNGKIILVGYGKRIYITLPNTRLLRPASYSDIKIITVSSVFYNNIQANINKMLLNVYSHVKKNSKAIFQLLVLYLILDLFVIYFCSFCSVNILRNQK